MQKLEGKARLPREGHRPALLALQDSRSLFWEHENVHNSQNSTRLVPTAATLLGWGLGTLAGQQQMEQGLSSITRQCVCVCVCVCVCSGELEQIIATSKIVCVCSVCGGELEQR